ncbi:gamma-glutamyl-gamma-aminobutyrate hydrolase family protein, partial [Candidatus Poribacteria bacterium]|nr:gamma-glutamyl-gamma-aminobutyrate hydrolase family protein [Candidatus Poribacteria bacterium]
MNRETIVVLDFGSQYTQLIARRIRERKVYCEIHPYHISTDQMASIHPKGIVLSGGPSSVYAPDAPLLDPKILTLGVPILGICYGMQLIAHLSTGGKVHPALEREYGSAEVIVDQPTPLFADLPDKIQVWMRWTMRSFIAQATEKIRTVTQGRRVLCAVSGGVDSTVLATLLKHALGDALICVFVNNGLLRKNEAEGVLNNFRELGIDVNYVDATDRFLNCLAGVESPEEKRKRIGEQFIQVFRDALGKLGQIDFLAQGTLYPDVIESVSVKGPSATIKTHHDVGGLPKDLPFTLIEPFRELFKDEVRAVGSELAIPKAILGRHPFPGPGLAVRVIGPVTRERLDILREAD